VSVKELRLGFRKRDLSRRETAPIGPLKNGARLRAWFRDVVRFEDDLHPSPNGHGERPGRQDPVGIFLESIGVALPHPNGGEASPGRRTGDAAGSVAIPIQAIQRPAPETSDAPERQDVAIDFGRAAVIAAMFVALVMISRGSPVRALVIGSLFSLLFVLLRRMSESLLPVTIGRTTRPVVIRTLGFSTILLVAFGLFGIAVEPWPVVAIGGVAFGVLALFDVGPRRERVLLVGGADGSAELLDDLARSPNLFDVATLDEPQIRDGSAAHESKDRSVGEIGASIERHHPDLVVVNVRSGRQEVFGALLDVAGSGFRVVGLPEFYEHAFGRVPLAQLTPAWFISLLHLYQRSYTAVAKRLFDVVVAAVAMMIVLPFLPLIALVVGSPMFFRQVRVGRWGKTFMMYKIRTMRVGAEELGNPVFAAVDDPRVTKVGRLLRKTRIDELPQLWNVLIGDMSIVGPRPERPEFDSRLAREIPGWTRRNMVKPGITGWAQINARYADDTASTVDKLSYDLWYLRHASIMIDLMICFRTLPRLVVGFGAR
jgi:exopolysaccharide biosynthesis polyprenyl glycosylphosphotransferase